MKRLIVAVFACMLFFSCASGPAIGTLRSDVTVARLGAGSADDESPSTESSRATAPLAAPQRLRQSALKAQVQTLEADMDAKLAANDITGALKDWDSIAALAGRTPLAEIGADVAQGKLTRALAAITFEEAAGPAETVTGAAFKKDYSLTIYSAHTGTRKPLAGFPVEAHYPSLSADGERITASVQLVTDELGKVHLSAPVPAYSVKSVMLFSAALFSTDPATESLLAASRNGGSLSAQIPYQVSTNAKTFSSTISILDFDKNGRPVATANVTATALLRPLVQKGFRPIGMADFPNQLASGDEAALLRAAKAQFGQAVRRLIYGTTKIDSLTRGDDGKWTCTLTAVVSVYDFSQSALICTTTIQHSVTAATEFAALDTARREIGSVKLVNDLLYRM